MDFAGMLSHERKKRAEEKRKEREAAQLAALAAQVAAETAQASAAVAEGDQLACLEAAQLGASAPPLPELTRLDNAPGAVWYCDVFFSAAEASELERAIRSQHRQAEWLSLTKRRLLNLGGVPHPDGMFAEPLPDWMQPVLERLAQADAFPSGPPNQCLLNEYDSGQGIDPHLDGPLYHPRAAILSLGSPALLRFVEPRAGEASEEGVWASRTTASVLMRPGSLVLFAEEAYERLMHGVSGDVQEEVADHTANRLLAGAAVGDSVARGERLSLTLRGVHTVAVEAGEFLQPDQQKEAARRRLWWASAISEKTKK